MTGEGPLPLPPLVVAEGELVVARVWSWKPEVLERSARKDNLARLALAEENGLPRPDPYYSISVYGKRRLVGEPIDDLVERLLARVREHLTGRWAAVVTETELNARGFSLDLSEPPADHYDLPLGEVATGNFRSEDLCDVFNSHERRKVPL